VKALKGKQGKRPRGTTVMTGIENNGGKRDGTQQPVDPTRTETLESNRGEMEMQARGGGEAHINRERDATSPIHNHHFYSSANHLLLSDPRNH